MIIQSRYAHALPRHLQRGVTLVEVVITMSIGALLIGGLMQVLVGAFAMHDYAQSRNESLEQARFALERMTRAAAGSSRLMVPQADNPGTAQNESVRDPGVLGVTLAPSLDRNRDGIVDADNDGDGLVDEEIAKDANKDFASGIVSIDDNNDGLVDNGMNRFDDDEDGSVDDDLVNGIDDDGDGAVDEDPGDDGNGDFAPGVAGIDDDGDGLVDEGNWRDDDEDGAINEDWWDAVVFYLVGSDLIERVPLPLDVNADLDVDGLDFIERVVARNVSAFTVTRIAAASGPPLLQLKIEITAPDGEAVSLSRTVRMGGGS